MSEASIADSAAVDGLTVTRWARYGHDRLYVQTADGTRLGYWDNKASKTVLEPGADPEAVAAALTAHRDGQAPTASAPVVPPVPVVPAPPAAEPAVVPPPVEAEPTDAPSLLVEAEPTPAEEDADLAVVRAGAAAREQALALKQAAPVKTFLARALGVKTDERAWRIGADGEEAVAARLTKLGPRWRVLHAVLVGEKGSDIDHVVVGPGGVFTVNAKHHPDASIWVGGDTFMVNGQRVPYVRNSRFEANRTSTLLTEGAGFPVFATGVIAVMGAAGGYTVKTQPDDVIVTTRKEIAKTLSRRSEVLTDEQVEEVYAVARRASTWRPAAG